MTFAIVHPEMFWTGLDVELWAFNFKVSWQFDRPDISIVVALNSLASDER